MRPGQAYEIRPGQARSDQIRQGHAISDHARSSTPDQIKPGNVRQVRQYKAIPDLINENRSDQTRSGHTRPSKKITRQSKAAKPSQARSN